MEKKRVNKELNKQETVIKHKRNGGKTRKSTKTGQIKDSTKKGETAIITTNQWQKKIYYDRKHKRNVKEKTEPREGKIKTYTSCLFFKHANSGEERK